MKVLICDDEKLYTQDVYNNVETILHEKNIQSNIDAFSNSGLVYSNESFYDIAFLDVEMEPYSGIETARKLKEVNKNIVIFFYNLI